MGSRKAYRKFEVKGTDPLEPGSIGYGLKGFEFEPRQETFVFPEHSDWLWTHSYGVLSRDKVARVYS